MANFSTSQIQEIWQKATTVEGCDPNQYRKDAAGAWIAFSEYGKDTQLGWNIDHVVPQALFSTDAKPSAVSNSVNLRPMHWLNNQSKGNDFPVYKVKVTSSGNRNIDCYKKLFVNEDLFRQLYNFYNMRNFINNKRSFFADLYGDLFL